MNQSTVVRKPYALFGIAVLLGFLALYFGTLREIALICWNGDDYSHGLLLPLISAYLIRQRFKDAPPKVQPNSTATAALAGALVTSGLVLFLLAVVGESTFTSWISFFPLLIGVVLLMYGPRVTSTVAGPILLLYMAKPLPDSLVPRLFNPLQGIAARTSANLLSHLGVPVHLVGNVIEIPGLSLLVEEACSGMRSVFALMTVAIFVLMSFELTVFRKFVVALAALFLAIFFNMVRVAATGILAHFWDPSIASGFLHSFTGMITFILGLVVLFWLGSALQRKAKASQSDGDAAPRLPLGDALAPGRPGLFLGVATLLIALGLPVIFRMQFVPTEKRLDAALTMVPKRIGDWESREVGALNKRSLDILKLDQSLRRIYRNSRGEEVFVYIGYWKTQTGEHQAAKHSPAVCLPSNGWTTWGMRRVPMSAGTSGSFVANELIGQQESARELFRYWFFSGERNYTHEWEALGYIMLEKVLSGRSDGGIVEISTGLDTAGRDDKALEDAGRRLDAFTRELYPFLDDALGRRNLPS